MSGAVTGVTVVTGNENGRPIGRTISAMRSVSAEPPQLLACIRNESPLLVAIAQTSAFAVNVLSGRQGAIPDAFAGRGAPHDWRAFTDDTPPLLHDAAARIRCAVNHTHVAGTHSLLLGAVSAAERGAVPALAYTGRAYVPRLPIERLAA
jgi:flavin reductase (DIM6/NTAB) family NADH-FMN oxidoreductase RutF